MTPTFRAARSARFLPVLASFVLFGVSQAQIRVDFSTADPGVKKAIPNWGLDTNWASADNMKRGLTFMGANNVNVVRVPAMVDKPQDSGLTSDELTHLQTCKDLAALVGPSAKWDLCAPGSDTVNAWFQSGPGTVNVSRWVQAMKLNQEFYNHPMWIVEPFNEPDYLTWGEGTKQNLYDIMGALQALPNFTGAAMAGGSTMSCDLAAEWYDALNGRASVGTTHTLYGTVANYVSFIQHVAATSGVPIHPEGHNVVEAIIGAEYGLNAMIWWGTAERTRGDFVQASMGTRLAYAEDRTNWTAAAVYRAPAGSVQAFLGSSERVGGTTTYTFHATDREVYYDGHGPQRDYTVTISRNQEKVVNITWGSDVQPVIGGRYALVNSGSGLGLDVEGASTSNGASLVLSAFNGAARQLWDVTALSAGGIGDLSYFLITNANSKMNVDLADWAYADDAPVKQYGYPDNAVEHWFFEYAGKGTFVIRSRWSKKCLSVSAAGTLVQRAYVGTADQLWRLQDPAAPVITTQPIAQLIDEGKPLTLSVAATGSSLMYQWRKDGAVIAGATNATYSVAAVSSAQNGSYDCVVSNSAGSVTSTAVMVSVNQTTNRTLPTPPANGALMNISTRARVGTGANVLIGGVVIGGGKAQVLVRAIGPSLASVGVTDVLADPQIEGITLAGVSFAKNDDWSQNANASLIAATGSRLGAFGIGANSKDSALLLTLDPGAYTFVVSGVNGIVGNALLEIYLVTDSGLPGYLANLASRGWAGTDGNVMIAGVVARGDTQVMVRGVGPALGALGVDGSLAKPGLAVYTGATLVDRVSMWSSTYSYSAASALFDKVGAFGLKAGSADSLEVLNLPGTDPIRTILCSGTDGGTGVALLEVYLVKP